MLQTQTVVPQLMELLNKIMAEKSFSGFNLVGGTALALQIGHRNSIDIDLFGTQEIDLDLFLELLNNLGETKISKSSKNILIADVAGIKIDFVNYKYPLLEKIIEMEGIRMVSKQDIAAMKLNAIAGRGSKKDFIDLYFLLQVFSLKEIVDFYIQKYFDGSEFMVLKSLTYFEDADGQPSPQMFLDFDWEKCKKTILEEVKRL